MTEDRQPFREIEANEQWLREVCKEPPAPSLDRIKLRVRLAVQELWLSSQLSDETPDDAMTERIKERVRTAVVAQEPGLSMPAQTGTVRRFAWWSIGVATAAAVLLAFVGLQNGPDATSQEAYVEVFVSAENDDFDTAIETLGAEVDDVEADWYESSLAQVDDWILLDIGEGLDDIPSDPFGDDDWLAPDALDSFWGGSGT